MSETAGGGGGGNGGRRRGGGLFDDLAGIWPGDGWLGIEAGDGRRPPGLAAPVPPGRGAAPGRGAPDRLPPGRGMSDLAPCPGRGRGAGRSVPEENGLLATRGARPPGFGPGL